MKKISLLLLFWLPFTLFSQVESAKFIVFRMDYQTYAVKYLYFFLQPQNISLPDSLETVYHDLYVHITPAGDFGGTVIRSRASGDTVYWATTVWNGSGHHIFPPTSKISTESPQSSDLTLKYLDFEKYFFHQGDEARADTAWQLALSVAPLNLFGQGEYGALVYLHYFSVGLSDPTTAEWVIIFYNIVPEIEQGKWENVGSHLPSQYINDALVHFAFEQKFYAATQAGAFTSDDGGSTWNLMNFGDSSWVNVTTLEAVPNPWVDCLCEYMYLGTEEYSMIPEELQGNIYRSEIDGNEWQDTKFPGDAVTAIGINPQNPRTAYAASCNPFYYRWGLYRLSGDTTWQKLLPKSTEAQFLRINCLAVSPTDTNLVLAGTSDGLLVSHDGGASWENHLQLEISSIQFFQNQIFVSTNNHPSSRSDGIWVSDDQGKNWQVWSWWTNCIEFAANERRANNRPGYFFLADSLHGIFVTREAPHAWQQMPAPFRSELITCLAKNETDPVAIVVGTQNGLYQYRRIQTDVKSEEHEKAQLPKNYSLLAAYPNPFNSSIALRYQLWRDEQHVRLAIYNSLGQEIAVLVNGEQPKGNYQVIWNGKDKNNNALPSGVYFCSLKTSLGKRDLKKIVLLR